MKLNVKPQAHMETAYDPLEMLVWKALDKK